MTQDYPEAVQQVQVARGAVRAGRNYCSQVCVRPARGLSASTAAAALASATAAASAHTGAMFASRVNDGGHAVRLPQQVEVR